MKTYFLKNKAGDFFKTEYPESLDIDKIAQQLGAELITKEEYEAYLEAEKEKEELLKPVKFTLPSSKLRKTSGEGIPEAISLVEDLLLLGNGTVNTSADGQEAIITVTKAFWDGISEERKTEINGLIQLAGGSIG